MSKNIKKKYLFSFHQSSMEKKMEKGKKENCLRKVFNN